VNRDARKRARPAPFSLREKGAGMRGLLKKFKEALSRERERGSW
jgi:hypothetical protein